MKETTGESTPRPDTSTSLPPDHSSFDEPEPEDRWGLNTPVCGVSGCRETDDVEIVDTEEYGQRALCESCREDVTVVGEHSCERGQINRSAREDPTRRSAACDGSGRKRLPEHRARRAMHASDPRTPEGQSADGQAYRLKCLETKESWSYFGRLDEDVVCPKCDRKIPAYEACLYHVKHERLVRVELSDLPDGVRESVKLRAGATPEDHRLAVMDALLDLLHIEMDPLVEDIVQEIEA